MNRRITIIAAFAVALTAGLAVAPRRYVVEGVSMGPALLPGDVVATGWVPSADRRRQPSRFDRWIVTLPDGSTGLKRVIGLPGETVKFAEGDLVIDGHTTLKGPRLLAEMGSHEWQLANLPPARPVHADRGAGPQPAIHPLASGASPDSHWSAAPAVVLDDAPFTPGEVSRLLLPVRDAGFAAELLVPPEAVRAGAVRVRASAGPLCVGWRLGRAGRYCVVAGRLDGHAVAAAWPLPADRPPTGRSRSCLPPAPPEAWDVALPWPARGDGTARADFTPALALSLATEGDMPIVIEQVTTWRDILYRSAANGTTTWSLEGDSIFVLGDFPSGSRDSRHFGALPVTALWHRLP